MKICWTATDASRAPGVVVETVYWEVRVDAMKEVLVWTPFDECNPIKHWQNTDINAVILKVRYLSEQGILQRYDRWISEVQLHYELQGLGERQFLNRRYTQEREHYLPRWFHLEQVTFVPW
jgi:hypothetical protein